ncbi:MAG: hypothetical protein H7A25_21270 [Leptospiraceae bacterium]|nr:hypothetical protein [Leptospiraceae bacterium]MCP5502442.1 hypothetical protein [Leptospiraceae bacterium]
MRWIVLLFFLIFLNSCASSSAGMATSNIPIVTKKYEVIGPVEKQAGWVTIDAGIFGFPLKKPPIHQLMNEAINEKEADALVNIRYWNDKIILLFFTYNRFGLNAEAVKFTGGESPITNDKKSNR